MNVSASMLVASSLAVGLCVLYPASSLLGLRRYHLASLAVGLCAWPLVSCVGALSGVGYTPVTVVAGLTTFAAVGFMLMQPVAGPGDPSMPSRRFWMQSGAHVAAASLVAFVAARTNLSFVSPDSWIQYELFGVRLHDAGTFTPALMGERNLLVPSLSAANRFFGGDWLVGFFPVVALYVLLLLANTIYEQLADEMGGAEALALAAGSCTVLGTTTGFLFQAGYVHSHMLSALYLMGSLVLLFDCTSVLPEGRDSRSRDVAMAIGGLFASGLVLARPDGPLYAVIPVVVVAGIWLRSEAPKHFFGMLAFGILPVYATAYASLGMWDGLKQTGTYALAFLCILFAPVLLRWAAVRLQQLPPSLDERMVMRLTLAVMVPGVAVVHNHDPEKFVLATTNMLGNLVFHAGYNSIWVFLIGAVVVSRVFPVEGKHDASDVLLFAVLAFFGLATMIHGFSHRGHLTWADSFSRIAFHIMPVMMLYVAVFVGRSFAVLFPRQARLAAEPSPTD